MQTKDSVNANYVVDGQVSIRSLMSSHDLESIRRRMTDVANGKVPTFPKDLIEYEPGTDGNNRAALVRKIDQCAERDEVFMSHAANPRILDVVETLIGPDIKLYGSQCFMKPPGGIEKPYHQDSAYFTIDPPELVTCWTALDDATIANGCLWVIPGSHREGLLDHDEPWQVGDRVDQQVRSSQFDRSRERPVELKAGDSSFHHSMLLHRSGANVTDRPRRGLAVHYMSAKSKWTHATKLKPNYPLLRGQEYDGCV